MAIDRNEFRSSRPGLKPEQIMARRANLTVESVEQVTLDDDTRTDGKRKAIAITFQEFPDTPYWPNGTSIGHLCDQLGEEEEEWVGERIPLFKNKVNNPRTKTMQDALWVAAPEDWDEFLREGKPRTAVKKNGAKKVAAKKRGK